MPMIPPKAFDALVKMGEERARFENSGPQSKQETASPSLEWRRYCEILVSLLAGRYKEPALKLTEFLEEMTLEDGAALVNLIRKGPWMRADADTRYQVLAAIDNRIIRLRERNGLPPFDDPLPSQPPTAFLLIRDMLRQE